jgi:hypothetical protein
MVISPKIMGGTRSLPSLIGPDRSLSRAFHLENLKVRRLGLDTVLEGSPAVFRRRRRR